MATIVTRAGKGAPLTHAEVDANFTGLNAEVIANNAKVTNATHTGDVTGATALTIANDAVTNAKLANMASGTLKGRSSAGTGDPEDLTGTQATALLDTFTSGAKGLVPASGGGTTNFLRADGTWAAPPGGGGGGSPGGVSGEVQWNNGGAFAGAADVEIEGGQLRLPAIETPATPVAGGLKLFGRSLAGRIMPAFVGPSGLDSALQPHIGRNKVSFAVPNGNSTLLSVMGMALTATGTATAKNWAATNRYTRMRGLEYLVTTASTSALAGWRGAAQQFTVGGGAAGDGGFTHICRWGPATGVATATSRAFVGLLASTSVQTDVETSSRTLFCGMGWDAADANIQFMHNDGSGTATKIDLGSSFPVPTTDRAHIYELAMFSPPGPTQSLSYEVTDLVTGAVATGTVTTDLPGTSTALNPYGIMSVGGTSSVTGICLFSLYLETDY
jgi:hypothetical protein